MTTIKWQDCLLPARFLPHRKQRNRTQVIVRYLLILEDKDKKERDTMTKATVQVGAESPVVHPLV